MYFPTRTGRLMTLGVDNDHSRRGAFGFVVVAVMDEGSAVVDSAVVDTAIVDEGVVDTALLDAAFLDGDVAALDPVVDGMDVAAGVDRTVEGGADTEPCDPAMSESPLGARSTLGNAASPDS